MSEDATLPLVVGISGASGVRLGVRVLDACRELGVATHLVVSRAGAQTLASEAGLEVAQVAAGADVSHRAGDIGASIASGSFPTRGMIIAPCSVRTMSEIATGVTSSLMTRAADVTLKERRPLLLCVRETPFNRVHLRNMTLAAEAGAVIFPCIPAFYNRPQDSAEMARQFVYRVLAHIGLPQPGAYVWKPEE